MGHWILNDRKEAVAVDLLTWAEWLERADRTVARTVVGNLTVSTVFLSLDHNFSSDGPPLLFETMVFGGDYQDRCSTYAEALAMHEAAVELAKGANALRQE